MPARAEVPAAAVLQAPRSSSRVKYVQEVGPVCFSAAGAALRSFWGSPAVVLVP